MLRSCLAMMLCGETSFDVWVKQMRDEPFYALISGFDPTDVPGVGTFYDFQDRLLGRARQPRTRKQAPHYRRERQDRRAEQKDKNNVQPHQNIINRLAERVLARPQSQPSLAAVLEGYIDLSALPPWEQSLQALFLACFVAHSVELNLIDLAQLHVAGDGTKLRTWANARGKKLCQCDNQGKKGEQHCRCQRGYRDPLARWGWDSYRECWVYGHSLYELTAYNLSHTCQLPLVVSLADCNRHDSVLALLSLYHAQETFGLSLDTASLDAAHDTLGLYRLATQRWSCLLIPATRLNSCMPAPYGWKTASPSVPLTTR